MTTIAPNTLAKRKWRAKPDTKELEKARRNRTKEWQATIKRRQTPKGWAKERLSKLRHRAKKYGYEFNLTWEDIIPPKYCPVFGLELDLTVHGNPGATPNAPSVDRIDNTKGYIKGNICVISNRANLLKKDASVDEIRLLLKYMEDR